MPRRGRRECQVLSGQAGSPMPEVKCPSLCSQDREAQGLSLRRARRESSRNDVAGIHSGLTQTLLPERATYIKNCSRTGTAQAITGSKTQAQLCSTPLCVFYMVSEVAT